MINIKLAKYSEEGKFEKYLELGKDFLYGGDFIRVFASTEEEYKEMREMKALVVFANKTLQKDEKDPLNRFDGLFNGRTYGDGRFVLIPQSLVEGSLMSTDDVILHGFVRNKDYYNAAILIFLSEMKGNTKTNFVIKEFQLESEIVDKLMKGEGPIVTNLHENPELWSKIK